MIDGKFDVIFRGQIVKSFEMADVKANLVKLFKSSPEAVDRLFGGKEVIIRKDLDYAGAMKYQSALKSSGALALIKEQEVTESQQVASQPQPVRAQAQETQAPESVDKAPGQTQPKTATEQTDGLSIADAGTQLLPNKDYEKREVDTSELSLATAGERILPNKVYEKRDIDTSALSLDEK